MPPVFSLTSLAKCSATFKNRPIGVGIQGFSDLLFIMHLPFESEEALQLSENILETRQYEVLNFDKLTNPPEDLKHFDIYIENDGTVEDLYAKARDIVLRYYYDCALASGD